MFPVYEQKKENVHILQKTSRHAPPHLHNSVEFIYVISGSMEIGMGQELFHMDEGDFAVIFPDVIHHYQVFEKGKNKSIYVWALPVITSNYMDTLQNLCPVDPVIKKADLHPDIKYVLQALLQQKNISKEKKEEIQNTSENVLEERSVEQAYIQILLARSLGKMKLMDKKSVESNDIVYQAVSYIAKHFREDLSLEKISKELGVNKFTLSRVFSGIFHKNFKQYINEHRLNYASAMLECSNEDITSIYLDAGFESQRTFNRVFKDRFRIEFYRALGKQNEDELMRYKGDKELKLSDNMKNAIERWKRAYGQVTKKEIKKLEMEKALKKFLEDFFNVWNFRILDTAFVREFLKHKNDDRYKRAMIVLIELIDKETKYFPELTKKEANIWLIREIRDVDEMIEINAYLETLRNHLRRKEILGF